MARNGENDYTALSTKNSREMIDVSPQSFSRLAAVYLRYLSYRHREHLIVRNDEGVRYLAHASKVVKRAVYTHAAVRSLATVRSDTSTPQTVLDIKRYLDGIQTRYVLALAHRDISALNRLNRAANTAMEHLANPNGTFIDLEEYVKSMAQVEERAVSKFGVSWTCSPAQNGSCADLDNEQPRSYGLLGGFKFESMNKKDRWSLIIIMLILAASTMFVLGVTEEFVRGIIAPAATLRKSTNETLPALVVTLCLGKAGIPHSRLLISNFTDADGNNHRGADAKGEYLQHRGGVFDEDIERFWSNPANESCEEVVGDFFPFPTESLNALAAGTQTTQCRACYRFGYKHPLILYSNQFARSSFLSVYTDSLLHECLVRPKGLSAQSMEFLHGELYKNINSKKSTITNMHILTRADGGSVRKLPRKTIELLTSKQLCNIFYFAVFPRELKKLPKDDSQVQYEFTGRRWLFAGTGPEFVPPLSEPFPFDSSAALESITAFVSQNQSDEPGNLRQVRDVVEIGPDAQTILSLRPLEVFGEPRYDIKTSVTNFVDPEIENEFGFWRNYRIHWKFDQFLKDTYVLQPYYSIDQWLAHVMGYFGLFVAMGIVSVFFLPYLYRLRSRERKQLRKQNSDAYLLRKYHSIFEISESEDSTDDMDKAVLDETV